MLARNAGYQSALIVRGVEGGVVPSLQQPSRGIRYADVTGDEDWRFAPDESGIVDAKHRAVPLPGAAASEDEYGGGNFDVEAMSCTAAEIGINALKGHSGPAYDSLVYSGSLVLAHLGRGTQRACAEIVKKALEIAGEICIYTNQQISVLELGQEENDD